jgi:hypothetical protein
MSGRIWCFYIDTSGVQNVIRYVYSDDQGATWPGSGAIGGFGANADLGAISFWEDEFGVIWVSFWAVGKRYVAYYDPAAVPINQWVVKEVS